MSFVKLKYSTTIKAKFAITQKLLEKLQVWALHSFLRKERIKIIH